MKYQQQIEYLLFSYKATGGFYRWELYYRVIATDEQTGYEEKAKGKNKDRAIEEAISKVLKKVTGDCINFCGICVHLRIRS